MRRVAGILLGLVVAASLPAVATANWNVSGSGRGYSRAQALPSGNLPSATVSGRSVTVSWSASSGAAPVSGYVVKRYDTNGVAQAIGSACSGIITALTCTEQAAPGGQWRYTVAPANNNWRGTESGQSAAVTVASPSLSLTPATVTSLPTQLSGQVANFLSGQTVTFRLDNAATGTLMSGSITPSPVPGSGTAAVSATLPAGTANGAHTVYAVGSAGDTASAVVTVSAPVTSTISTSAWDGRDASAGTGGTNQSDTSAFAEDARSAASGAFVTAFASSRYVQYAFNNPLPAEGAVSAAAFNFSFAGTVGGETTCFYFDVRRISTGAVLATHGSAAAPVACTTTTSFKSTSTSLPEVSTNALANDLQIRVYASSSGSHPLNVDLATVSGVSSSMPFTLYEKSFVDSSTGAAAEAVPWSLYAADSVFYTSSSNWATTFASSRYLKLSFPAYVPADATLGGVSFKHSYRSASSGGSVCYYFEVYSGTTLIGTHGSAVAPISCTSSSTVWQTDTVALPEVTTPANANSVSINLYVDRSVAGKSRHDLAELLITYTK
jgi:hypothetical protein